MSQHSLSAKKPLLLKCKFVRNHLELISKSLKIVSGRSYRLLRFLGITRGLFFFSLFVFCCFYPAELTEIQDLAFVLTQDPNLLKYI